MKPSAKRALLLPAWPERRLYWRVAGFWARGLLPILEERARGVGPLPALRGGAAVRWASVGELLLRLELRVYRCGGERGETALQ